MAKFEVEYPCGYKWKMEVLAIFLSDEVSIDEPCPMHGKECKAVRR